MNRPSGANGNVRIYVNNVVIYNQKQNNSNYLCELRALCGDQNYTPQRAQRAQRAQSIQDICQRYYVLNYKIPEKYQIGE